MTAFDCDATDYIQKPIAIDRFNASVKKLLNYISLKMILRKTTVNLFLLKTS
jgi:DNA-binding LytR/AlgR family response regulator